MKPNVSWIAIFLHLWFDIIAFSIILPWLPSILQTFSSDKVGISIPYTSKTKDIAYLRYEEALQSILNLFHVRGSKGVVVLGGNGSFIKRSTVSGILSSISSFAQFIISPIAGVASDYYGRKPTLIFLNLASILSYLIWLGYGRSLVWFALFRLLCGATRSSMGVISAMVSDISTPETRTSAMAVIGASYGVGFTVGPLISTTLLPRLGRYTALANHQVLGLSAACLNALSCLILLRCIPETLVFDSSAQSEKKLQKTRLNRILESINPKDLISFKGTPQPISMFLGKLSIVWFGYTFLISGLEYTLLFLTQSRYSYTSKDQGLMFFGMGLVMITIQGIFMRRFKCGREPEVCALAIFSLAASSVLLGLSHNPWLFHIAGLGLFSFASAAFVPSLQGMASMTTDPNSQGQVLGTFRSLNALARATGPTAVAIVFWLTSPETCYIICAILLTFLVIYFRRLPRSMLTNF